MMYDYSKLKGRIIEIYDSYGAFADAIGTSRQYVSKLINNKGKFTIPTIEKWRTALNIPVEEIGIYFFSPKVNK